MAENRKLDIDYFSMEDGNRPKKSSGGGVKKRGGFFTTKRLILFISAGVLIVAAAVAAVFLMTGTKQAEARIVDSGAAVKGIFVGNVDISGMTKEQALAATAKIEADKLAGVKLTFDINGEPHEYGAADLSVTSDYKEKIDKAFEYAHTGTFEEREAAAIKAAGQPVNFDITLKIDDSTFQASLDKIKTSLDKQGKDATMQYTPWGYTQNADGTITAFEPDKNTIKNITEAEAKGKEYTKYPERALTAEADMPSLMKYEFYENSKFKAGYDKSKKKFVTGYLPANAKIARFYYTPDVKGLVVDMNAVADDIKKQVETGSYEKITVPCQNIDPAVTLASLKSQTQLITSWTSSFSKGSHYNYRRNWNVAMVSNTINGTVLEPGVKWSVNSTLGPRNNKTAKEVGWKKAAGIENGGTSQQVGGGVCQLGSTIYNAALRCGSKLKIVDFTHHSIPSDYIPVGIDATLNTAPARDLVLRNDNTSNYYLVSYINPTKKNVTVEIYGPGLVDDKYGNSVIYTFISERTGRYGSLTSRTVEVESGFSAPDGTIVTADNSPYEYAKASRGTYAKVWKLIFDLNGKLLEKTVFSEQEKYPPITGTIYECPGDEEPTDTTPTEDPGGGAT